jgi:IclR family transcriptional regulator, acetate operon repressor
MQSFSQCEMSHPTPKPAIPPDHLSPAGHRIQVIDRLAALLNALASNGGEASLKVLSAETALHPSTAFRILAAAGENGLIERTEAGHYGFGGQLAGWAACRQGDNDLRALARPAMEWLRDQVEETVNLTQREGDEVIYIERATPKRMMRVEQVIGSRAPLHVTAVGKLMLGSAGQAAVWDYAARTGLTAYTEHTLTRPEELWSQASLALAVGYALDNEEAEIGVGCIGVLLRDPEGEPLAGLSISAPLERRRGEWVGLIQVAAQRIAERIAQRRGLALKPQPAPPP